MFFKPQSNFGVFLLESAKHPTCNLFAGRVLATENVTSEGPAIDKALFAFQTAEEETPQ